MEGLAFVLGLVLGAAIAIGVYFLNYEETARKCARQNNVYDCVYVGQWIPAPPK